MDGGKRMQHAARRMICGRGGTCSLQPLSVELMGTARGQKVLIVDTRTLECLEEARPASA